MGDGMTARYIDMTDGRSMCLRPLHSDDEPLIEAGILALSDRSRYLRFFSQFKKAPQSVIDRLTNFSENHIAWGAVDDSLPNQPPIAAAHFIHSGDMPDSTGEFAIAVLDDYQSLGVARALSYCLLKDVAQEGYEQAVLDVLGENRAGISLFQWMGGRVSGRSSNIVHMELDIVDALARLSAHLDGRQN